MSQPVLDPASRLATECLDASGISGGDLHTILSQPCSVTTSSSHFSSEKHGSEQRQRPQAEEQLVPTGRELEGAMGLSGSHQELGNKGLDGSEIPKVSQEKGPTTTLNEKDAASLESRMQSGQWGKLLVLENYCKPLEKKSQTVEPVASSASRGTVESNQPDARAKRRTETQTYSSENGVNRSNCQRSSKRSGTTAGASLSYTQPPSSQHSSSSDLAYARGFWDVCCYFFNGGTRAMQV